MISRVREVSDGALCLDELDRFGTACDQLGQIGPNVRREGAKPFGFDPTPKQCPMLNAERREHSAPLRVRPPLEGAAPAREGAGGSPLGISLGLGAARAFYTMPRSAIDTAESRPTIT